MKPSFHFSYPEKQRGASLVVTLLMLVAVLLLGVSAAQIALQGEKASRGDRDRQVAFQAAEAALMDAEMDIENSPSTTLTRSSVFKEKDLIDNYFISGCGTSSPNGGKSLGLCQTTPAGQTPIWLTIDFSDTDASTTKSAPFGKFTGQEMQTGTGSTPARLPRYIIEKFQYTEAGASPEDKDATYFFRITAIGYGMRDSTRVVLQSFYRKIEKT